MASSELIIAAFLGIALVASIVSRETKTPYTIMLVLVGMGLAASSLSVFLGIEAIFQSLISGGLFVGLVLPPLLFETMMNIKGEEFRAVSRPALLLATLGVVIATVVGGILLWRVAGLPLTTAFLFAALISPTDVATVLEIFGRSKVPGRLATLMETEAVFNDATGITIFTAMLAAITAANPSLIAGVQQFIIVFGGGVVVGLNVALGATLLQRSTDDAMSETVLTVAAVYGSYAAATAFGVSGLIAVAVTGLVYGNATVNAPHKAAAFEAVKGFWKVLAFIANTVAFLFIGFSTNIGLLFGGLGAIGVAYVTVVAARYISVRSILTFTKVAGQKIPASWRNVAWLGGMRGALSIVLVASLPATLEDNGLIATMTLGVAFVSIMLQGPLLSRYVKSAFKG
jgi:Na+:H+ antiporter